MGAIPALESSSPFKTIYHQQLSGCLNLHQLVMLYKPFPLVVDFPLSVVYKQTIVYIEVLQVNSMDIISLKGQPYITRKEVGLVNCHCPATLNSMTQSDCSKLSHDHVATDMPEYYNRMK